jgi:hypothetical protein
MAKGVNHYLKDGKLWSGNYHKMPNGNTSKPLFHYNELSATAKKKARSK